MASQPGPSHAGAAHARRVPAFWRSLLAAAALVAPIALVPACTHEYHPYKPRDTEQTWELGGRKLTIEIAKDDATRQKGLMYRKSMPDDAGMLFVYPEARVLRFWMKNTSIPLSIAFFQDVPEGPPGKVKIVNIEDMQPYVESGTVSLAPVRYALEMNQGWFAKNGVKAGDVVTFPEWVTEIVASEGS